MCDFRKALGSCGNGVLTVLTPQKTPSVREQLDCTVCDLQALSYTMIKTLCSHMGGTHWLRPSWILRLPRAHLVSFLPVSYSQQLGPNAPPMCSNHGDPGLENSILFLQKWDSRFVCGRAGTLGTHVYPASSLRPGTSPLDCTSSLCTFLSMMSMKKHLVDYEARGCGGHLRSSSPFLPKFLH